MSTMTPLKLGYGSTTIRTGARSALVSVDCGIARRCCRLAVACRIGGISAGRVGARRRLGLGHEQLLDRRAAREGETPTARRRGSASRASGERAAAIDGSGSGIDFFSAGMAG